jgi:hypothetical protein
MINNTLALLIYFQKSNLLIVKLKLLGSMYKEILNKINNNKSKFLKSKY